MQYTKDSFYMALLQRLESLYPQYVVTINGTTRPAIIVAENEMVIPIVPLPDAFYLEWGATQIAKRESGDRTLMSMECVISHHTFGVTQSGVDRGRALAALDIVLMNICQPLFTAKQDYTQTPSVDLGTNIFWTFPDFGKVIGSQAPPNEALPRGTSGVRLERTAKLNVFFFPEVSVI